MTAADVPGGCSVDRALLAALHGRHPLVLAEGDRASVIARVQALGQLVEVALADDASLDVRGDVAGAAAGTMVVPRLAERPEEVQGALADLIERGSRRVDDDGRRRFAVVALLGTCPRSERCVCRAGEGETCLVGRLARRIALFVPGRPAEAELSEAALAVHRRSLEQAESVREHLAEGSDRTGAEREYAELRGRLRGDAREALTQRETLAPDAELDLVRVAATLAELADEIVITGETLAAAEALFPHWRLPGRAEASG